MGVESKFRTLTWFMRFLVCSTKVFRFFWLSRTCLLCTINFKTNSSISNLTFSPVTSSSPSDSKARSKSCFFFKTYKAKSTAASLCIWTPSSAVSESSTNIWPAISIKISSLASLEDYFLACWNLTIKERALTSCRSCTSEKHLTPLSKVPST